MEYIYVGQINGTHGLKGELKLKSNFKYKDKILKENFNFYIGKEKTHEVLKKSRTHNKNELLTFKNKEDINLVEDLRNNKLYINKEDLNLKENEYVLEDYLNLECYYNNQKLGTVKDIIDCGNKNYVLVIKGQKEILIPLNNNFIEKLIKKDRIILKEVEDLINANWYINTISRNV